jgi:hypothetical protein
MKFRGIVFGMACAASLACTGGSAFAQVVGGNPTITVDENGVGSLQFPGGGTFATAGVLAADPGPGGLALALTYNLLGPPGLVAGDLVLLENGVVSDVIRFNPAGSAPGYQASLVFYSDNTDGGPSLADRGFPTAFYPNNIVTFEVGPEAGPNGFTYIPGANDPGFIPGFSVTYVIQSDLASVPEPSTLALFGLFGTLCGGKVVWKAARKRADLARA